MLSKQAKPNHHLPFRGIPWDRAQWSEKLEYQIKLNPIKRFEICSPEVFVFSVKNDFVQVS